MGKAFDQVPSLKLKCFKQNSQTQINTVIRLPIFINRFIEKVEMPLEAFKSNWESITLR